VQVASVRVSTIAHATEDVEKVIQALKQAFSQELSEQSVEKRALKGHFGNQITTLAVNLRGRLAESLLSNLWGKLSPLEHEQLLEELNNRVDEEGRFYFRLDKQECFRGGLRLRDQDPIKVQFSFRGVSDRIIEVRQLLESYQSTR
jgi:RNA binding exosome subunit